MRLIFLTAVLLFQSCTFERSDSLNTGINNSKDELNIFIQKQLDESKIPGLSAVIINNDSIAWKGSFGYADINTKKPFTANTIINIASVSKIFIGMAVMIAKEKGLIDLDEDINKYLKGLEVKNPNLTGSENKKITIRELATHTSTIVDRHSVYKDQYFSGTDSPVPLKEFLYQYLSPQGKLFSNENFNTYLPGTCFEYSNIGAALCAEVIEEASNTRFIDFCKENIFKPLEMNNTGWLISDIRLNQHAKLYDENIQEIPVYGLTTFPDGGLRTSVEDISKFLIMVMNTGKYKGKIILGDSYFKEMLKEQFVGHYLPVHIDTSKYNQAIFWQIEKNSPIGSLVGHTGADPGVRTYMYFSPAFKKGIILFINKSLDDSDNKYLVEIVKKLWVSSFKY